MDKFTAKDARDKVCLASCTSLSKSRITLEYLEILEYELKRWLIEVEREKMLFYTPL